VLGQRMAAVTRAVHPGEQQGMNIGSAEKTSRHKLGPQQDQPPTAQQHPHSSV